MNPWPVKRNKAITDKVLEIKKFLAVNSKAECNVISSNKQNV